MLIIPVTEFLSYGQDAPHDQALANHIGAPKTAVTDRHAVVDKTNKVVACIKAIPGYSIPGHLVIPHNTANIGDTYLGAGQFQTLAAVATPAQIALKQAGKTIVPSAPAPIMRPEVSVNKPPAFAAVAL